jgi:putative phage-type endonuclease
MGFYVIDNLEQGSREWLDWRKGVIGASDAPTIMGENPWAKPSRLLEEKLGVHKEFHGNAATREGHRLEEIARKEIEQKFGETLRPTIVQDAEHPFLAASLDAINSKYSNLYEIKCGVKAYEIARSTRTTPKYYVAQLQHMMMITGIECVVFAAYRPSMPLVTFEVSRDDKYIKHMRSTEIKFVRDLLKSGHSIQSTFKGKLML